jgi:hypothetical protein
MPSVSQAQQRAFGAALGGAKFPLARKLRASMSTSKLKEFASTPRTGLPKRAGLRRRTLASHLTALRMAGKFTPQSGY